MSPNIYLFLSVGTIVPDRPPRCSHDELCICRRGGILPPHLIIAKQPHILTVIADLIRNLGSLGVGLFGEIAGRGSQ